MADAADVLRVVVVQGALAGLRGGDRDAGGGGELREGRLRPAVVDSAARDDERPPGLANCPYRCGEFGRIGDRSPYVPGAFGEELVRPVVRLGLNVLRESERHGSGLDRVGEHAHGVQGGGDERFRPGDPVEVPRHRAQAVVHRHIARVRDFELLEHRVGGAAGEGVAGEEQDRKVVDGREGGAGDEVRGAGADGRRNRVCGQAIRLTRVANCRMDHGLFVAALVVRHLIGVLDEGLAEPGHVAVAEDAPGRADQPPPGAVPLGELGGQEPHQRLRDREPRRRGHR